MLKKFVLTIITFVLLIVNVNAGSSGDLILEKNQPDEVKDCFEKINRATFAFNQALDGIIFKPVASVYRVLPSPVKTGVSNSLNNLSNVVTIPNNILQGEFKKAGINSGRFILNTTIGILGFVDPQLGSAVKNYDTLYHNLFNEIESRWNLVEKSWELNISKNLLDIAYDHNEKKLFTINPKKNRRKPTVKTLISF